MPKPDQDPAATGPPGAVLVSVGESDLWVRGEAAARRWDLAIVSSVLQSDEYGLESLARRPAPIRTVLDIGGHIGSFTLKVKRLWPRAEVIAAEPDPDSAALFRANTAHLGGIRLEEAAVVGQVGLGRVHLRQAGRANADRNAAASRVAEIVQPLDPKAKPPTTEVRALGAVALLDSIASRRIDLVKLDCEAAEAEILTAWARVGRLERIGSIRGEWHFAANRPRIERALRDTHTCRMVTGGGRSGGLFAEPLGGSQSHP